MDILDCAPGIVSTAGTNYTKDEWSCTSEECARWALKALGKTDYTAGHWKHTMQEWMVGMLGDTITLWFGEKKLKDVTYGKVA